MARKRRQYGQPNCNYSVTTRINDPEIKRFQDRGIAKMVMNVLKRAKERFGCQYSIITIMGTHDHFDIKINGAGEDISKVMHWINFMIATEYNRLTGHKGRLWRERFKSKIIHDWCYFLNTLAYIARNPERANLGKPDQYPFSSAIYLYQQKHPFPEFEEYRDLCQEQQLGLFNIVKEYIEAQRKDEMLSHGLSMAPKVTGTPKKK